jgi:hypothetical protein
LQDNLHFHYNWNELHKYVDPEVLPVEYGGIRGKIEDTTIRDTILQFEDYFKEVKKLAEDNKGKY